MHMCAAEPARAPSWLCPLLCPCRMLRRWAAAGAVLATASVVGADEYDGQNIVYGWDADAQEDQDEWGLPAFRDRKIKVQRLSPAFGRYAGGLLVDVIGKGTSSARGTLPLSPRATFLSAPPFA